MTTFSIAQVAKMTQFPGGEMKFFEWLRANKYLQPNNEPYQQYIRRNWFVYVPKTVYNNGVNKRIVVGVPRVTIIGLGSLKRAVSRNFPPCKPKVNGI